ncbi:AAA domain-containing protein [Actinokineospora xionganensis]|uniref:AAA family ATPase n=1 Tax=Actinokineospora xionganensis TaxID=2684470 RepID=A0ABR7KZD7_9PSEU|nr:AAA domain-containing protein [Actinokineospora xionganensis]MBC6445795.1 AAA family ATPase [Actinokineospora xionganensis]
MIDARREAVIIRDGATFKDKTAEISRYEVQAGSGTVQIVFKPGSKPYPYGPQRVRILRATAPVRLDAGARVEVAGAVWESATEIVTFVGPPGEGAWSRIFYRRAGGEAYRTYPAAQVRVLASATQGRAAAEVLRYFRAIVARLPADDPLKLAYDKLGFVHPDSALGAFLAGAPIEQRDRSAPPIFPFRCNLSQRAAVENGLTRSVSVIEGPPGTGKTETILNLIANIIAGEGKTVGVVSFSNTAVDNVRDKLDELGFGHVIANLGRKEKCEEFFAGQAVRNARVGAVVKSAPPMPDLDLLARLDQRLTQLQHAERARAELRQELDAHRLELRHFERHLPQEHLPDLTGLPLLRRSAERIVEYLAESEVEHGGVRPGLLGRVRKYFKYGSLRGLDAGDTNVVLRLQRAYYDKKIAELEDQLRRTEDELRRADFDRLAAEHQGLAVQVLSAHLGTRYRGSRTLYQQDTYRRGDTFAKFLRDYPVVLSTCHSLRNGIPEGHLLDYLIIDEASQVNLPVAALAMSMCRNLIVVGDQKQLPPIPFDESADLAPPAPAYDCRKYSILSSLGEGHGEGLPRALLREHYRCDPAIIGFCNKKFYDGDLIPYTTPGVQRPMIVVRTVEGNHMRRHTGGGRSNQREVDVIALEVVREHCLGAADADISVITPYRIQADKVGIAIDGVDADTVHKYQGRQKKVVVLSTVLDETWPGQTGLRFVDDPQMVNVAVSRAVRRFVLVTNHDLLPRSRHIRDLVGYISYHDPDHEVVTSTVISVFDLLYSAFSARLRPLAARLRNKLKYPSEDIIYTVLQDILAEQRYAHLAVCSHVLLKNLLADTNRLTQAQAAFVGNRASIDFVVYNRITNLPLLAVEVDGFAFHENNPAQLARDALKDEILRTYQLPLLRLPTTGSDEERRIRQALDAADVRPAQ